MSRFIKPPPFLAEEDQKRIALDLLLDAWDTALQRGCQPETLATTAIYAALTDMIDIYGADPVAEMIEDLPDRIRAGEFTLGDGGSGPGDDDGDDPGSGPISAQ
ncbi:MAG: hypothetical protein RID91_03860 [Azospirillaceae bacterium]